MKRAKIYSIALTLILGASLTFANASIEVKKEMTRAEIVAAFHKKGVEIKFTNKVDYSGTVSACGHTVVLHASSASEFNTAANGLIAQFCGHNPIQ